MMDLFILAILFLMQHMEKLECIDLSHSQYLVRTPDFSGIPNLERLIFEGCTDLREVH